MKQDVEYRNVQAKLARVLPFVMAKSPLIKISVTTIANKGCGFFMTAPDMARVADLDAHMEEICAQRADIGRIWHGTPRVARIVESLHA